MNDRVELEPAAFLNRLERTAWRTETPCGEGNMVWRCWGEGPVLVLFHGGAGSWRHWAHNIDVLSREYRLLVPDLPGLGESAFPPTGDDAMAVARIVAHTHQEASVGLALEVDDVPGGEIDQRR